MSECRQCGNCCRKLLVEANHDDVVQEPRLLEGQRDPAAFLIRMRDEGCVILLGMAGPEHGCRFLDGDRCSIYPTRPAECRRFRPGTLRCRYARGDVTYEQMCDLQERQEAKA